MKKSESIEVQLPYVQTFYTEGTCDICGKTLWDSKYRPKIPGLKDLDAMYYEVTTSHTDWGNDSIESIEDFDVCPDCFIAMCQKYLKKSSTTKEMSVSCAFPPTNLKEFDKG